MNVIYGDVDQLIGKSFFLTLGKNWKRKKQKLETLCFSDTAFSCSIVPMSSLTSVSLIVQRRSRDLKEVDLSLIERDITVCDANGTNFPRSTSAGFNNEKQLRTALTNLAQIISDKSCIDPEWGLLAGRLLMEDIHLRIPKTFSEATSKMKQLLHPGYYEFVMKNGEYLNSIIDASRDFSFDYFAVATLLKSYLCHLTTANERVLMESPQYMYLRVATYLHYPDLNGIGRVYTNLKNGNYSHATPTLFNAGMRRPALSSCYLQHVDDDTVQIAEAIKQQMIISKNAGGLGVEWSSIRHSEIGNQGLSDGIVPWIRITDRALKAVTQGGKRKGSGAMYLRDLHTDIFEFVELQDDGPEEIRTRDLFLAIMVSDLFMRRVENDGLWSLFCPNKVPGLFDTWGLDFEMKYTLSENEGLYTRQVRARELWVHILNMQIKRGMPFILYIDACNRKSNQQHSGLIRSSNLCVAGDTMVLTDSGYEKIQELEDVQVNVWNGKEWSKVTVKRTGTNKDLVRVKLSNGAYLDCTPEHKFYLEDAKEIRACDLVMGMHLLSWTSPYDPAVISHTVVSIEEGLRNVNTYCFTEPKRHMGVFNGILTGQCTEILEVTNKEQVASCTLASICLNKCVDYDDNDAPYFNFDRLAEYTAELVQNLNNVIDRNYYPEEIPQIKYSNDLHRPLGIGVQGLADAFALLDIAWVDETRVKVSKEAEDLNRKIFECMYYSAVKESINLAKIHGPYPEFVGSPASKGLFQPDLWDQEEMGKRVRDSNNVVDTYNEIPAGSVKSYGGLYTAQQWNELRREMVTHGLRNSLLLALMPTASSAHILGNIEAFEPLNEVIYARTVLSGQFMVVNKHAVRDLKAIGLWNTDTVRQIFTDGGSIQGLTANGLDHSLRPSTGDVLSARLEKVKLKYLSVFEIPQKILAELKLQRGRFICQTQSYNCFMDKPNKTKLTAYHFYMWKNGAKTGMYYLRQKVTASEINMSINTIVIPTKTSVREECVLCQA